MVLYKESLTFTVTHSCRVPGFVDRVFDFHAACCGSNFHGEHMSD